MTIEGPNKRNGELSRIGYTVIPLGILLALITLPGIIGGIEFDSMPFGVRVECEGESNCPHAMLITPIDNSLVDTRDVTLTLYIYDNDESVWFLNVTFYDNNTDDIISSLVGKSDMNISCVWTNLTPGQEYEWYGYLVNSSGGNYTTGIYSFTVSHDFIGTASDFYGTWIMLGIIVMLILATIVARSVILSVFTLVVTILMTTFYQTVVMSSLSSFDQMIGYIFFALLFFVFVELAYIVFYGRGK